MHLQKPEIQMNAFTKARDPNECIYKSQRSSTQMSAFLVNGKLIIDKYDIRDMWADHFEEPGTPDLHTDYDNNFAAPVSALLANFCKTCLDHPVGVLSESLSYEEVAKVCSSLKSGISGVTLDYERIRFAGPPLWHLLHELYGQFFLNFTVPKSLKTGLILPLFKGKGAKANNKDNYQGITPFSTLRKIYEMILLNRLEKFAVQKGYFSELQFGFGEGVGCTEASFAILETINHMLERGSKVFSCFLDVRKAFDTVWIDGLLFKLFSDLGINGRMWLALKDLYTDIKAVRVLFSGSLSRKFNISQGTGQGRLLAPFMYKVCINGLLKTLSEHCFAISINSLSLPSPSFADDVTLLALFTSFLQTLMNLCHDYSLRWRYQFNHIKSGVATFGECKQTHTLKINERAQMASGSYGCE